ncbi:2-dehydro-3-deoxyphosphogluconate aldolase/(4S)-4-hydroxy-2-oxoglutarate aldolase [Bacillus niacini]|uniref:2-dehydro-3-deoxyphosphogluconate aldolase/(4S)-4-hydroxy-2-oxoglutarate aldolase n=1 Tax=Neobacillus niacini TaxID=86668 RepID=A0A852TAB5_9BACI|nr:bifunctional 4-hydroxy-2-oxoglutarate aldolase/2-dehydro-3-deoxy-phosphogluconate aldolase [Neobacillus niacini]NYE05732.1 2-dehydro-3-deoxyphosphogluconate aldolase/(4S)-4-hydroxy-2-oxoglutarate aldolase [Neobacillus niacini]
MENALSNRLNTVNELLDAKIISILRHVPDSHLLDVVGVLIESGIRAIEVTLNSKNAIYHIEEIARVYGNSVLLGAGTVTNGQDVVDAYNAGARYILTPYVAESVVVSSQSKEMPVIMGAMTPTEVANSKAMGADLIKIFPAERLGSGYIKDILAPLDDIKIFVVGGINSSNAKEYLDAGAVGIGVGGNLVDNRMFLTENWKEMLSNKAQAFEWLKREG